jgi:hypothetical protein
MLFKFTGKYTGGRESITVFGVTFQGREPADVTDEDGIRRLSGHPEFERVTKAVTPEKEAPEIPAAFNAAAVSLDVPKKRGRPRK